MHHMSSNKLGKGGVLEEISLSYAPATQPPLFSSSILYKNDTMLQRHLNIPQFCCTSVTSNN